MPERFKRYTLPATRRLSKKRDFERILAAKCTAGDDWLVVYAAENGLSHPRLGLIVGKRHGKATRRNRLRRLLREAFRLEQHELPQGFDYVLIPRAGQQPSLHLYRGSLLRLAQQAARRWRRRTRLREEGRAPTTGKE